MTESKPFGDLMHTLSLCFMNNSKNSAVNEALRISGDAALVLTKTNGL
jgi:hypothetical protein